MKIDESCVARRRFLGGMLAGGTAALAAGAAVPLASYTGDFRQTPPPEFLEIAPADYDVAPGESNMVMYGRIPVLIFRTPEPQSELAVFDATCTHFDCTVSYRPANNDIHCACHNGVYDVDGRVVSGPPPDPLRRLFTRFRDDTLVIALEKENLEKAFRET